MAQIQDTSCGKNEEAFQEVLIDAVDLLSRKLSDAKHLGSDFVRQCVEEYIRPISVAIKIKREQIMDEPAELHV